MAWKPDVRHYAVLTEGLRSGLGGLQMLLLTAALGPHLFGQYSQGFALATLAVPIVFGGATYWLQPYLQKPDTERAAASHVVGCTLLILTLAAPLAALALTAVSSAPFLGNYLVLAAEMGFYLGWTHLILIQLGRQRGRAYTTSTFIMSLFRVATAASLFLVGGRDLVTVGSWLVLSGAVGLCGQLVWMKWRPGRWFEAIRTNRSRAWSFSAIALLESAMDGADKVILGRALSAHDLGTLAASSRLNSYALVPGRGLEQAAFPKFFVHAENSRHAELRALMRKIWTMGVAATAGVAVAILLVMALTRSWLFPEYPGLLLAMVVLMPRMVLRPVTYVLGDTLYALGKAASRLGSLALTAGAYLGALLLVAPQFGIPGVAVVGLVTELANITLFGLAVRKNLRLAEAQKHTVFPTSEEEKAHADR